MLIAGFPKAFLRMSSTLEWLTQNVDFFFWTDSVFALRDTKTALKCYLKETVESHFKDKWSSGEILYLQIFIQHNAHIASIHRHRNRCTKCNFACENIWRKIVENHADYNTKRNPILFIDKTGYVQGQEWWTFLKFFLPEGFNKVKSFEECDASAICKILKRCKLFQEIDDDKLAKVNVYNYVIKITVV